MSTATAERVDAVAGRVSLWPGWSVTVGCAQIETDGPDLVDSDDPDATFPGGILLDLDVVGVDADRARLAELVPATIVAEVTSCLHEIAEWAAVDGVRLFAPHLSDYTEWDELVRIAVDAVNRLTSHHPLSATPLELATLTAHTPARQDTPWDAPVLDVADPAACTGRVEDLVAATTLWPGVTYSVERGEIRSERAAAADANDPSTTTNVSLYLWSDTVGLPAVGTTIDGATAARAVAVVALVDCLHEITEWLRVDGGRVFDPHPAADDGLSFDVCAEIAAAAVADLFATHARPTYTR